ncbi:hypothetical protein CR513_11614, partial [Mucuna pruriens]
MHDSVNSTLVYEVFSGWKSRNHPSGPIGRSTGLEDQKTQPAKDLKEIQIGVDPHKKIEKFSFDIHAREFLG